jgi:putative phosphoesterase
LKKFLVIGDFHIPRRAREIPTPLLDVADAGDFDAVLCTGDLVGEEILDLLSALAPEVHAVSGNMDTVDLPEEWVLSLEGWTVGLFHGAGIVPRGDPEQLGKIAERLGVDILVHGHTHNDDAFHSDTGGRSVIFVNPGSATGMPAGSGGSLTPSLAVMRLSRDEVEVVRYRAVRGTLNEARDVFPRP